MRYVIALVFALLGSQQACAGEPPASAWCYGYLFAFWKPEVALEPVTELDLERSAAYCEAFFTDITETDGVPRELLVRLLPPAFIACVVRTVECFNQTPGPGAGAPLSAGPS